MKKVSIYCLVLSPWLGAQDFGKVPKTVPALFALKNATVVVGNGEVLSNATVIIREGLIEAVGTSASVPPLAWELDLSGMYVYPGIIDALTEEAYRKEATRTTSSRTFSAPAPAPPSDTSEQDQRPGLFPHIRAADRLDSDSGKLAPWRNAGILSLNVAPDRGIFMGQTALVNLNGEETNRMIVRSPVAMRMSFQSAGGFRTFPGSLMGVIAHIKQTVLDAQHYRLAHNTYGEAPRGLERPETDRALQALQPAVEGSMPLIFPAKQEREIRRVVDLAGSLKIKGIVAGAFEANQVADLLKERRIPALVSLNFPEKPKDRHPEAEDSLSVIRYRQHAPKVAAELHQAGIPFAFYSDGLKTGQEFLKNLRRAVKEGLPKEAAVRAATLSAAEILQVEQQLGSVEKGKIANLIVADRDLFDEKAVIKYVFVDGEKYEIPAAEKEEKEKSDEN